MFLSKKQTWRIAVLHLHERLKIKRTIRLDSGSFYTSLSINLFVSALETLVKKKSEEYNNKRL